MLRLTEVEFETIQSNWIALTVIVHFIFERHFLFLPGNVSATPRLQPNAGIKTKKYMYKKVMQTFGDAFNCPDSLQSACKVWCVLAWRSWRVRLEKVCGPQLCATRCPDYCNLLHQPVSESSLSFSWPSASAPLLQCSHSQRIVFSLCFFKATSALQLQNISQHQ